MADNEGKDVPKVPKRTIARYVGINRDGTSKDTEKNRINSDEKPPCEKQQTKQRFAQPLKARGLQGPFRPSIVGVRKHEDKRKRNESEDNTKFLHHIRSYEDLSPKRNQAKESLREKSKCKVDFSNEAETKFTRSSPTEVNPQQQLKFHAKGSKPNGCTDLKKSKKELAGHVFELEEILAQLRKERAEEEKSHTLVQNQLKEAREAQSLLEKTLSEMKTEITQKELNLSEHAQHLTSENKELLQTVADCRQKLQACKIDPVTLKPLELNGNEKQELEQLQQDSESNAQLLQQKLEDMNQKHRKMIANIQTHYEKMKEVEILKSSP